MIAPVIVGFDGSKSARAAVRYGADEAVLRDRELRLVYAFIWPLIYPPIGTEYDPHDRGARVATLNLLAVTARDVQQDHPQLSVSTRLLDGSPGGPGGGLRRGRTPGRRPPRTGRLHRAARRLGQRSGRRACPLSRGGRAGRRPVRRLPCSAPRPDA